ncbi:MAG: c-type cytochrome [Gemmatimonadaceae bacterium]
MTHFSMDGARRAFSLTLASLALVAAACGGAKDKAAADSAVAAAAAPAVADGAAIYARCATCHQPTGLGTPGTFPPLAGSEIANGPAEIPIRIVLKGLQGPITVHGAKFDGVMPAYGVGVEMSDEEVATVLTWVRSQWGNTGTAITPAQVATERAAVKDKVGAWTAKELGLK